MISISMFFFFKQKTAYEIVSGDWSSDVCSSDLFLAAPGRLSLRTQVPGADGCLQISGAWIGEIERGARSFLLPVRRPGMTARSEKTARPVVRVENLVKRYSKKKLAGPGAEVRALDGVSFSILKGTTLAIVGQSGSGKSTLALCLACLEKATSGSIWFEE